MADIKNNTYLFLDDVREPSQAYAYTNIDLFIKKEWKIVRNYEQFRHYIETYGLPKFISFDHDLALSHYTPEHFWNDYEASKKWQEEQVHEEKTGYDCAKFLIDYCAEKDKEVPDYYCHSMNPVGKDKIITALESFKRFQNMKK